ncbi:MAG: serine/threonine-protein kinase [Planctomycetota bacterium]
MVAESRIERTRRIFTAALELPAPERMAFVREQCGADRALREDVQSLLHQHEQPGDFMEEGSLNRLVARAFAGVTRGSFEPPQLAAGDRLGDFEIESFLARGGFGEVYCGRQTSLAGRKVALKVLREASCPGFDREHFLRGARTAASLHHPNLVEVYGCGEDPQRGLVYYAMRLVQGPTLADILEGICERGEPPSGLLLRFLVRRFLEIAKALGLLHAHGFIHRDIKPANIVIDCGATQGDLNLSRPRELPAILVDFGLVRQASSTLSTRVATLNYAAPEQLEARQFDVRADVYSLGLCMYDCLTARGPERRLVQDSGEFALLSRTAPDADADLEAVLARATERNPRFRYPDARALARDLEAWLERRCVAARPIRGLEKIRRWIRHHPERVLRWITRGGVFVALAVILLFLGSRAYEIVAAHLRCEKSWQRGDLITLKRDLDLIPPFLDSMLAAELGARAQGLRELRSDDPAAQVIKLVLEKGMRLATLHAARLLERDGLLGHPELANFLLRSIETSTNLEDKRSLLELVARLFLENPDTTPEATKASGSMRHQFLALLAIETDPYVRLNALTALSGCATPQNMPVLLEQIRSSVEQASQFWREEVRLGLHALELIVRRSHSCATLGELDDLDLVGLVEQASRVGDARRYADIQGDREPVVALLRALAFACRAAGLDPGERIRHGLGASPPAVRAACLDRSLRNELRQGPDLDSNEKKVFKYEAFRDYGTSAGSYDDDALETELETCVRQRARECHLDEEWAVMLYRRGLSMAHDELQGIRRDWLPDSDTHLGAFFSQENSPFENMPIMQSSQSNFLASWDFTNKHVIVGGAALGVEGRCVQREEDQYFAEVSFLRLGVPGLSRVHLVLELGEDLRQHANLVIAIQKARRGLLPFRGAARLQVFVDGSALAEMVAAMDEEVREITLPLQWGLEKGRHEIALQLSSTSNTTLRLHSVALRAD